MIEQPVHSSQMKQTASYPSNQQVICSTEVSTSLKAASADISLPWLISAGAVLVLSFLLPIYSSWDNDPVFFWDMNIIFGLIILLAGCAVVTIQFVAKGLGKSIAVLAIGFLGIAISFFPSMRAMLHWYYSIPVLGVAFSIPVLAVSAMLAGNVLRIEHQQSTLVRMLEGFGGSFFAAYVLLSIISIANLGVSVLFGLLYVFVALGLLASAILAIIGFGKPSNPGKLAKTSNLLLLCSISAQILLFCAWYLTVDFWIGSLLILSSYLITYGFTMSLSLGLVLLLKQTVLQRSCAS